ARSRTSCEITKAISWPMLTSFTIICTWMAASSRSRAGFTRGAITTRRWLRIPNAHAPALGHIGALFRIEREIADASRSKKEAVRRARSKPVLDKYFAWCAQQAEVVLDESPIQKAIQYALNHEQALRRF